MPAAGGEPRQLASEIPFASTPAWSPDGRRLLFVGVPRSATQRRYTWFLTEVADDLPVAVNADDVLGAPNGQVPTPSQWRPDNRVLFSARGGQSTNLQQVLLDPVRATLGEPERLDVRRQRGGRPLRRRRGTGGLRGPHLETSTSGLSR